MMPKTQPTNLETYLSEGVEAIVKDAIKATLKNPKESLFLSRYAVSAKRAAARRHGWEEQGEHIPSFLIASITTSCNLHCTGCYAHANQDCGPTAASLSTEAWSRVFDEAEQLGVAMILLAGGEPLMRRDVIQKAADRRDIVFPVFTNGTLLDDAYLNLFDRHRNLVPIVSIEGDGRATDARRGEGVYAQTQAAMERLRGRGLLFGASITVTRENLETVSTDGFVGGLRDKGCKVVLFIEYVPVDQRDIALSPEEQGRLDERVAALRQSCGDMVIISFPGDEKEADGCLAAGRGFVHINPGGGAEPCPFSPYSDTNVTEVGLRKALQSPLFGRLRDAGLLRQEHTGGCVLFERQKDVERLLSERIPSEGVV